MRIHLARRSEVRFAKPTTKNMIHARTSLEFITALFLCAACWNQQAQAATPEAEKMTMAPPSADLNSPPTPNPQETRTKPPIEDMIRDLGHEEYAIREAATTHLFKVGPKALPALKKARRSNDLEIGLRAKRLIFRIASESMLQKFLINMCSENEKTAQRGFLSAVQLAIAMSDSGKQNKAFKNIQNLPDRVYPLSHLLQQILSSKLICASLDQPNTKETMRSIFQLRWKLLKEKNLLHP